ncbi:helix-turn-helix transcriptional regulator [Streptomyces sp. NPDC050738]|uniref:helix-turn-helix domain-containing protein n=1 Tax=Streptomyces sp. NPDC050738 TaxID=3154744 RepID=UPI0034442AA4
MDGSAKRRGKRVTSWHLVGAQIAGFRKHAGMTQQELAAQLCISDDKMASIEQGRRPLHIALAVQIDDLLDTKRALEVAVGKVPEREKFPVFAQDFIEYEQDAVTLLWYEIQVVPGLLQTEQYARAVFECRYPPVEDETVDDWVAARMARQKVWERRQPPRANFVLEEAVLRRPLGGREVMRDQIRALRDLSELPCMGVQIMPMDCVPHAALDGPMVLLETPDHDNLAYVEGQRISQLIDDPDEVSIYQQKYGMLRSQALSPWESTLLLDGLLGES